MKCPKCGNEVALQDVDVIYGLRDGKAEVLAAGELVISTCCGVAILADRPKKEETIITPEQKIIIPT